jgi:LysM repeat protein
MVQKFRISSLTVSTALGFVLVLIIFSGYTFVLRTKDLTARNSELQYVNDEKLQLLEQNHQLEEQLAELQARCGESDKTLSGAEEVTSELQAGNQRSFIYIVKEGDTIWDIATFYSVNVKDLMRWNNLGPRSQIFPGDQLTVILEE